ncbi:MAG: hypothetical protein Q8R82_14255 [Hyphomonadaceae bacterium]|nr:hypothetical protein [Hyphomonadaceae bacterium]
MTSLKKGSKVYWMFGDTPTYKIVGTKTEPYVRQNGEKIEVEEGKDFMIIKTPLEDGEFAGFQHVHAQHLELVA